MDFTLYTKYYLHQREFVERFLRKNPRPLTEKGYILANERHKGHSRLDGSPYIVHLIEVLYYLILIEFDDDIALAAGITHDGPEDKKMTHEEVLELLTKSVGHIVYLVTKPKKKMTNDELKEHFICIFKEIRALVLKIIDRVANMKRSMIGYFHKEKLTRYCDESEYVIIPLLEGFIAVIEDPNLLDDQYPKLYGKYSKSLRILRSFLKGFLQAGREHIKCMEKNEQLEKKLKTLEQMVKEYQDKFLSNHYGLFSEKEEFKKIIDYAAEV